MSYSIDRSARTRGVNAIAAMDLRGDDGGGAVVRTGQGPVVIVSKHEGLGASLDGWSAGNPYKNKLPREIQRAIQWEKDHKARIQKINRRASGANVVKVARSKAKSRRRTVVHLRTARGVVAIDPTTGTVLPTATPPSSSSSPFTGGGGGGGGSSLPGGGGGGGDDMGPSPDEFSQASEAEIQEQEAATQDAQQAQGPDGEPSTGPDGQPAVGPDGQPVKAPMSTGMKLGLAAAAGWALWSMFGGN